MDLVRNTEERFLDVTAKIHCETAISTTVRYDDFHINPLVPNELSHP